MKKKKIVMIHHSGLIGGGSMSMYNNWLQLKDRYNVSCYVPNDPPHLMNFLKEQGLEPEIFTFRLGKITYYNGGNKITNIKFWYHSIRAIFQIPYWKKVLKKEKPDLIIINSKVLSWMGSLFKNYKSICFVRETILGNPKNLVNKFLHKQLDKFSVVSFISNYDLEQTDLKHAQKIVSYNFLDIKNFEDQLGKRDACNKLGVNPNSFNIVFTGGIEKLKGIDIAVKALKILENENINLIVAGNDYKEFDKKKLSYYNFYSLMSKFKKRNSTKFANQIKQYIKENSLSNLVHFVGIKKNMAEVYSSSDLLIFPMNEPHQARPVFEIGVQKKPVIVTDFENIQEFVLDGENGLTFEVSNENELAECIIKLKKNKVLLKKLGENNYLKTLENHTVNANSRFIVNQIEKVLK